jgi:Ca2+-binding RTX toxin-like protein
MKQILQLSMVVAALAVAAPASAATISYDGNTLVYTASPGEADHVVVSLAADDSSIAIQNGHHDIAAPADRCENHGGDWDGADAYLWCEAPQAIRADLGDGDDYWSIYDDAPGFAAETVDGGAGNDELEGTGTMLGGSGNDKLTGSLKPHDDNFDGGDGNDVVDGKGGNDHILGGAGDDTVRGDHYEEAGADVIDGGPGLDTLDEDYSSRFADKDPLVDISIDGGGADGRPGENDDVRGVESVKLSVGGTLTGTDAPETLYWGQVGDPITVRSAGGNDTIHSGDGADTVDGGAGDDQIDAGFGDDTIDAGPGRDTIFADRKGGDCGPLWCKYPYGNDTVDIRDGEVDSLTCGFGEDSVKADANDVIDSDCEHVDRGAAPAPGSGGPPVPGATKVCVVPKLKGLTATKARARLKKAGCVAKVKGRRGKVRKQSARAGRRLAFHAKVTVTMER